MFRLTWSSVRICVLGVTNTIAIEGAILVSKKKERKHNQRTPKGVAFVRELTYTLPTGNVESDCHGNIRSQLSILSITVWSLNLKESSLKIDKN